MFRYRNILTLIFLAAPLLMWGQSREIQVEKNSEDPNHTTVFVGPLLQETPKSPTTAPSSEMESLQSLQRQMDGMNTTLLQLQETLDYLVNQVIADLEAENADLYRELQRVYMHLEARGSAAVSANVPRPGGERIQAVLEHLRGPQESVEEEVAPPVEEAPPEETPAVPAAPQVIAFTWEILDEWGRSPEVVAELGKNVTSLKGMICHVTPGAAAAEVKDLGRDLRQQYADYDNINIEIFDDKAAAEAYIKNRSSNPAHQVLSIAKHLRSNRDVILYYDNGTPMDVAF